MISAGLLNKIITIQQLSIKRDDYGSDMETWNDLLTTTCNIKGFDTKSILQQNHEIFSQYSLLFTIRKKCVTLTDPYNHYRILYDGKIFNILNINVEDRDTITLLGQLLNS
jgi:head-tail adaptor